MSARNIPVREFDALVVGAGGAGLRAALHLAEAGCRTAVLSKVFPTRSHTVAAQGGVAAALGNFEEDRWQWHMFDTVKGSDWLGDQDAIEFMCRRAGEAVIELEHYGMPFDRGTEGKIFQRPFGGHMANFGERMVRRACVAADRTGHALLHTLYQRNVAAKTQFFVEWMALDLLRDEEGVVVGVTALEAETGEVVAFRAKATIFATGGAGRAFASSTNALINTGDGLGMAARAGIPLEDMEFWQFHPTGIAGAGVLITEAARSEGALLRNAGGERFMLRYAPVAKELASRDLVSRAMLTEIAEGRGAGPNKDYLYLDLTHLDPKMITKRLPSIHGLCQRFAGVDCFENTVPVVPTCHYQMGGIPTDRFAQVVVPQGDDPAVPVPGFYAAGECACASVHGANRLGTNSLLDLLVFGKSAGESALAYVRDAGRAARPLPRLAIDKSLARLERLNHQKDGANVHETRTAMQRTLQKHAGVFRFAALLKEGVGLIDEIAGAVAQTEIRDKSKTFNTARLEALELDNLIEVAKATMVSAEARKESRGAHKRDDAGDTPEHPNGRDDENWLKHTLWYRDGNRLQYKPVHMQPLTVDSVAPSARSG